MALPRHAFFRGRIVPYSEARVGVLTHALNYGTGVFGGIRGYWNADEPSSSSSARTTTSAASSSRRGCST